MATFVSSFRICAWLVVFALAACAPQESDQFRWSLKLESTGGISGQGQGQVSMTSDGRVEASRLGRSCAITLGSDDLRAIQQAVGAVAPGNWGTDYQPSKTQICCDRVSWLLEVSLEMGDGTKRAAHADWHEAAIGQLPPDLRALAVIAQRILDRTIERCGGG